MVRDYAFYQITFKKKGKKNEILFQNFIIAMAYHGHDDMFVHQKFIVICPKRYVPLIYNFVIVWKNTVKNIISAIFS